MKIFKFIIGLIMIAGILISCDKKEEVRIVAQVNKESLTYDEFKSLFTDEDWDNMSTADKQENIQKWVKMTILAQEADNIKISESQEIKSKISAAEKKIKANALIAQKIADIKVTEEEVLNYYRLHKSRYQREQKEFAVQRIFIREREKLNDVLSEISEQRNFTEAARKYSEENIASNGGYAGFLSKTDMHEDIWNKLNELERWYYSTVQTPEGFYIVRHYDTRTVKTDIPLKEVKDEIAERIKENKKAEIFESTLNSLKSKAEIVISI